jgi:hypothetical protein
VANFVPFTNAKGVDSRSSSNFAENREGNRRFPIDEMPSARFIDFPLAVKVPTLGRLFHQKRETRFPETGEHARDAMEWFPATLSQEMEGWILE